MPGPCEAWFYAEERLVQVALQEDVLVEGDNVDNEFRDRVLSTVF